MSEKTNKELYAELAEKLKAVEAQLDEIGKWADENELVVEFFGAKRFPKTEMYRDTWGEEREENNGPSDGYDSYDDEKGQWWVPSHCY